MVWLDPDIPALKFIEAMFLPVEGDTKWAYRHDVYPVIRKAQRKGTKFMVLLEINATNAT
jgi:hypothetical protein